MSQFNAFMAGYVAPIENKKIIVSNRFIQRDDKGNPVLDKDGKTIPVEWEIRAITTEENDELLRKSMVTVKGRNGSITREVDQIKYTKSLLAASVVSPDLTNAALQDSYKVMSPEALLSKMLYPREESVLAQAVTEFSQIETLDDLVKEAKN